MSRTKKKYDDIKQSSQKDHQNDFDWVEKVLYTKDKIKKSSLKNGDGFGFDSQRLSSK